LRKQQQQQITFYLFFDVVTVITISPLLLFYVFFDQVKSQTFFYLIKTLSLYQRYCVSPTINGETVTISSSNRIIFDYRPVYLPPPSTKIFLMPNFVSSCLNAFSRFTFFPRSPETIIFNLFALNSSSLFLGAPFVTMIIVSISFAVLTILNQVESLHYYL